jgi:hypothetical protein
VRTWDGQLSCRVAYVARPHVPLLLRAPAPPPPPLPSSIIADYAGYGDAKVANRETRFSRVQKGVTVTGRWFLDRE